MSWFIKKNKFPKYGFSKRVLKDVLESDLSIKYKIEALKACKKQLTSRIVYYFGSIATWGTREHGEAQGQDGYDDLDRKLKTIKVSEWWLRFIEDKLEELGEEVEDDEDDECTILAARSKFLLKDEG